MRASGLRMAILSLIVAPSLGCRRAPEDRAPSAECEIQVAIVDTLLAERAARGTRPRLRDSTHTIPDATGGEIPQESSGWLRAETASAAEVINDV